MSLLPLLDAIKIELKPFFKEEKNSNFVYHNIKHTRCVVSNAKKIAEHYKLNERDTFVVLVASWFHDIGYFVNDGNNHEIEGALMAEKKLREKSVDETIITDVKNCILATKLPQEPHNLLEQIVCDADLFHFGTDEFDEFNSKMRKEAEWRKGTKIDKNDWRKDTIQLLELHKYKTDYAQNLLNVKKSEHLKNLKKKMDKANKKTTEQKTIATVELLETETAKKAKAERPDKAVETMFRISSSNHQRLSDMADNKAHIMITTTSIIISVLLGVLLRKLEDNPQFIIPTILLLTVCVITMVFSILATRPAISGGKFSKKDLDDKKVNLLFFGNFYKMDYDDYLNGMKLMMNDKDFLYNSLSKDLYSQGVVLGRKYKLLRTGYNVFMFGIVASVLAFSIAVIVL